MDHNLFAGSSVRLAAVTPDELGELIVKWAKDTEFLLLWGTDAPVPRTLKKVQEWLRKELEKEKPGNYGLVIQRIEDDKNIGLIGLWGTASPSRSAWVSIGIGEREYWGKGYGTEAMNLILRFAFIELNLHRVNLDTFSYNPRAIRSYEKVGFVHEGVQRGAMRRRGERADLVYMGILRDEWLARQPQTPAGRSAA